jgi:hypothetical protein
MDWYCALPQRLNHSLLHTQQTCTDFLTRMGRYVILGMDVVASLLVVKVGRADIRGVLEACWVK